MTVNCILTCVMILFFSNAYSKKQLVILEWKFKGIEEGYDHLNRIKVFVDGAEMPVSKACHQSEWGNYPLKLSKRHHQIRLVNEAFYQGKWVEHTFENEFSINAVCAFDLNAKIVSKVRVEFDLNGSAVSIIPFDSEGNVLIKKAHFKGKHYPMEIDWKFIHVEQGYDHPSRMLVYVDDLLLPGNSSQSVESKGGVVTVKIPKGSHRIRIVNQSFLNGSWQDHTIVNNFSVDAVYEKTLEVRKPVHVTLIIDLNDEHTVNIWK